MLILLWDYYKSYSGCIPVVEVVVVAAAIVIVVVVVVVVA